MWYTPLIGCNMKLTGGRWKSTEGTTLCSDTTMMRAMRSDTPQQLLVSRSDMPQQLVVSPATMMRALRHFQTAHSEEVDVHEQALKDAHLHQPQEAAHRHHLRSLPLQTCASHAPQFSRWSLAVSPWMQTGESTRFREVSQGSRRVETLAAPGQVWYLQTAPVVCLLAMLPAALLQQGRLPVGRLMTPICHRRVRRMSQQVRASEAPWTTLLQTGSPWQGRASKSCRHLQSHHLT